MAGNVDEWVSDWYGYEYYSVSPGRNPQGPAAGETHVVRGGNWDSIPDWVRCAWRDGREPEEYAFGFRCVAPAMGTP
jgi:iron(II)-dependent oxidoreductase